MKKIIFVPVLLISLCFIFNACNNGLTGDAYTIKMRLNKGDTFNYNTKMKMLMNYKIPGQDMNMNMNMDAGITFKVLDSISNGKELQLTYKRLTMGMDMGNAMPTQINSDSILNASIKNIIGKNILLDISPTNEITTVKGLDSIMAQSVQDEAGKKMMEKMFSKDQMNNLFGIMFSMYPSKAVQVGETWTSKTNVSMADVNMKLNVTYKLIGVKNGLADIDVAGVIDGKGKMEQSGMSIDMSMTGTQKGTITIRMSDGYLDNGAYKMDVKADMEVMGQKIPVTMKADYYLSK